MQGETAAIVVTGVRKTYGETVALDDMSFAIRARGIVAIVGENGAGKTTALRILTGYIQPDSGTVVVGGFDRQRSPRNAGAQIGYLPETAPMYPEMRVREYLYFRARLRGLAKAASKRRVDSVTEQFALGDFENRLIEQLSKGMRQRVGLADALIAEPPIVILDEPTSGLDPTQVRGLRDSLVQLATTRSVIISSHALADVAALECRILLFARGRLVADGPLSTLRAQARLGTDSSLEEVFAALSGAE